MPYERTVTFTYASPEERDEIIAGLEERLRRTGLEWSWTDQPWPKWHRLQSRVYLQVIWPDRAAYERMKREHERRNP